MLFGGSVVHKFDNEQHLSQRPHMISDSSAQYLPSIFDVPKYPQSQRADFKTFNFSDARISKDKDIISDNYDL